MTTVQQEKKRINQLLSRDATTDKEIDKTYNDAVDRLRAVINQIFDKYSVEGVVVPANLHKKVTRSDMLLLKRQYDKLPDDLELPEIERRDNYVAISQTSQRGLITATLGIVLMGATHHIAKILQKNNQAAVNDEAEYIKKNNDLTKTQNKRICSKAKQIVKPDYSFTSTKGPTVFWFDHLMIDHDKTLNRIDGIVSDMLKKGMRAEDIANTLFPENAESMRKDNIPKELQKLSISAKRIARTEAAKREDELTEQAFKSMKVKEYNWVTEPGACKKCTAIALAGPYKFGDPDSPRPPADSHPNCRCRRVATDGKELDDTDALLAGVVSGIMQKDTNKKDDNQLDDYGEIENVDYSEENVIITNKHSVPLKGTANSIVDTYKDGTRVKRRYYDSKGLALKDIDFTDHGNPKEHPIVPHAHDWNFKKKRGNLIPQRSSYRKLTKTELKQLNWRGGPKNE